MTQAMTFGGGNLPAKRQSLKAALQNVEHDLIGAMTILKFAKGDWTYGSSNEEASSETEWMVDPYSFEQGYIAWGGGKPVDEIMVSMLSALPDPGPAPAESLALDKEGKPGRGWQRQSGFRLKGIEGPQKGTVCRFTSSSDGGRKAIKILSDTIAEQLGIDEVNFCPIIKLEVGSYQHPDKDRGRIKFPKFTVEGWVPELGSEPASEQDYDPEYEGYEDDEEPGEATPDVASAPVVEPEPAPAQTERRRRR